MNTTFSIQIIKGEYKSVTLSVKEGKFVFDEGNIIKDWYSATIAYLKTYRATNLFISYDGELKSTLKQFCMDVMYLVLDEPLSLSVQPTQEGILIIVRDMSITWDEFVLFFTH